MHTTSFMEIRPRWHGIRLEEIAPTARCITFSFAGLKPEKASLKKMKVVFEKTCSTQIWSVSSVSWLRLWPCRKHPWGTKSPRSQTDKKLPILTTFWLKKAWWRNSSYNKPNKINHIPHSGGCRLKRVRIWFPWSEHDDEDELGLLL